MACIRGAVLELGIGNQELVLLSVGTLLVELILGYIAYHMIVDVGVRAEKKARQRKGGMSTGTIRGVIIGASKLRSGHDEQPPGERKNNFSSRYAILTLKAPGVHNKTHRLQSVRTDLVEDDPNPVRRCYRQCHGSTTAWHGNAFY